MGMRITVCRGRRGRRMPFAKIFSKGMRRVGDGVSKWGKMMEWLYSIDACDD